METVSVLAETRMTVGEAAIFFNRTPQTIRKWMKEGDPYGRYLEYVTVGNQMVTSKEACVRLLEGHTDE